MNFSSIKTSFQIICIAALVSSLNGCATKDTGIVTSGYKGVINLEAIKLGVPEEAIKSASLTFVADANGAQGETTQYLSRAYDKDNGQYCLSYSNGQPWQLRIIYNSEPVSKENALAKLKSILPPSAPEETKVDNSEVTAGKKESPVEYHFYGDNLKAEIIYANKAATAVKLLTVRNIMKKDAAGDKTAAAGKTAPAEEKKAE
ncbi:MAG TPA: hypothetical protein EYN91_01805 [Candidatus Melainabacteria bacterium]|jgi:hypothetical protein|nr:hypothetical protein [Candidatus Melainabacteria bacterium]HIN64177.1 hypothetical protein [Candidatus Obscuribacterales bacterium]